MISASFLSVTLKIREFSEVTLDELKKATETLDVDPQFYIYKILFELQCVAQPIESKSNEDHLNYYRDIIYKLIELYPDLYSYDDVELYSKFALVIRLYNIDKATQVELDFMNDVLKLLEGDIESGSLKWLIREMTKNYILRYYMYHEEYYHLIRPLVDELLVIEDEFIKLLDSIS